MKEPAFTTDVLDWAPWSDVVDLASATPEQLEVVKEGGAYARTSAYVHLLLHDAPAVRERAKLLQAIMYGPGGLPRAERELGATAESMVNGCVYCTSVHARFYNDLTQSTDVMARLFADGVSTPVLDSRQRAVVDYAVALGATPPAAKPAHVEALRRAGLSDGDILDLANAVAMFAWANRLMLTLGEPVRPESTAG